MDDLFFSTENLPEKYAAACSLCADFAIEKGQDKATPQLIDLVIEKLIESDDSPVKEMINREDLVIS